MPGHVVHLELANKCFESMLRSGASNWAGDSRIRNAFYHGALDPDMGYFPGGDGLVTELAHYIDTGDLARALLDAASSEEERAYALGWVTHLLGDAGLHPVINEAAGMAMTGVRGQPMTWVESPRAHMRVEFGLDLARARNAPAVAGIRLDDVFDRAGISFVAGAFHSVYGIRLDESGLLRSHRAVTSGQRLVFRLGNALGRSPSRTRSGDFALLALYHSVRVSSNVARNSSAFALTHGWPPQPWLLTAVDEGIESLSRHFTELVDGRIVDLPNVNLDTGVVDDVENPYEMTVRTNETLVKRLAAEAPHSP